MNLPTSERAEIVTLSAALDDAPWGGASEIVAQAARDRGVSRGTIWRWVAEVRGHRRRRFAKAPSPNLLALAGAVAEMKQKVRRDRRMMSTARALEQITASGGCARTAISRATIDRRIRQARTLIPAVVRERKISERPNDMHQFDVTGSKVLYVAEKSEEGDWILETRPRKFRRNQALERLGLWIYGVVDDHSRVRYLKYIVAAGESFEDGKYFLSCAWGGDPRCELRGLPRELNCDYGPLRSSERGQHLMESLGVAFTPRMPESPNVGGKIERIWRDVFRDFESLFDLRDKARIALHELNEELCAWCAQWNRRAHPDWPELTRLECYAKLDPASIRYFPEDVADGIYSERVRVIDEFARFRYRNAWYRVPDEWTGNVEVIESYDGCILARRPATGDVVAAPVAEPSVWGTYRRHFDTPNETLKKAVAGQQFSRVSFAQPGAAVPQILSGKFGRDAEIVSPFTAEAAARTFANEDAAVDWARGRYGVDIFLRNLGLSGALRELARAVKLDRMEFESLIAATIESEATA